MKQPIRTMTDSQPAAATLARNRRIAVAALLVGAGFLASKVTGILDDLILARIIGPGRDLDAYYAAFSLPDLLFTLVAGGALASAFIPVISGLIVRDRAASWRLVSVVANLAFVVTLIGSTILALFAPWVVSVTVGRGFTPEQQLLTASLMRLILISTAIFSVSAVVMSTLQAHQHFFLPALAPILYNLGILAGVIILAPSIGVWGPAIGVVAGSVLHLSIQIPGLARYGARWTPSLNLGEPHLRRVLALLVPRVLGLGVVQLAFVITTSLASLLSPGSVTALNYAWRVMQLPETVIATAVATAVFPTLSELAALGKIDELRATVSSTLRSILALTAPATVGLLILGRPFVRVLFEGGLFEASATDAVAWALQAYALGLFAHSMLEVCARIFYAQQDTWTPLYAAAGAMIVAVAASLILRETFGHAGLALANSIGVSLEVLALMLLAHRRLRGIDGRRILISLARFVVASLVMGVSIAALQVAFASWSLPSGVVMSATLRSALDIGIPFLVAASVGLLVYVVTALALGSEEMRALPRVALRRRAA